MSTNFKIQSSNPKLLEKAIKIAEEFSQQFISDDVVGIVFLGAIVRGYFDNFADIDIAIFKKAGKELPITQKFLKIEGMEVQIWLSDYESEISNSWDMARRWTYSQSKIFFDPQGKITRLLAEKVPLTPDERKWLLMSGLTLSEWYINGLTQLWVERGNIISAHHMFAQGVNYFFDMLFGFNNQLVADMKWRYYCVEQLEKLPQNFQERIKDILIVHSFTTDELERRKGAFMEMWEEMKPLIEEEVHLSYDEIVQLV
jgi:hypothetical protein